MLPFVSKSQCSKRMIIFRKAPEQLLFECVHGKMIIDWELNHVPTPIFYSIKNDVLSVNNQSFCRTAWVEEE